MPVHEILFVFHEICFYFLQGDVKEKYDRIDKESVTMTDRQVLNFCRKFIETFSFMSRGAAHQL